MNLNEQSIPISAIRDKFKMPRLKFSKLAAAAAKNVVLSRATTLSAQKMNAFL